MSASDRREVLAGLAMLGMAPLALGLPRRAAAQGGARHTAPQGEFVLTRTLERQLGAADHLRVIRQWNCSFRQSESCIAVAGAQVSCMVEAPAMLAPLAQVEQTRPDTLFPLELNDTGLICAASPLVPDHDLSAAAEAARALLGNADPQSRDFIATLAQTASQLVSAVPDDLFFPQGAGNRSERTVPLGPAGEGSITVTTAAKVRPLDGLLVESIRDVSTSLRGVARRASERWALSLA